MRIVSRIESFQLQQILIIKISNYKWSKRDVQNYIFLITILKHIKLQAYDHWSLIELASLYTVPQSAVNGLSRLTNITTSKGADTADSIRKFSNRPIPFESNDIGRPIRIRISKLRRSLVCGHHMLCWVP